MRFQYQIDYDTELIMADEVIEKGRTLLPGPEPERYDALQNWAQLCANAEDQPVTWRASKSGEVAAEGVCYPDEREVKVYGLKSPW